MYCDYFMLVTWYKVSELCFRLLGTNDFHVKAENEACTVAVSRCRRNRKYENFKSSFRFGRLCQKNCTKSVTHVQHDSFPHSTNQIIDLWCCRYRCLFLNSLLPHLRFWRQREHKQQLLIANNYFNCAPCSPVAAYIIKFVQCEQDWITAK